jgi:hypothetical protein
MRDALVLPSPHRLTRGHNVVIQGSSNPHRHIKMLNSTARVTLPPEIYHVIIGEHWSSLLSVNEPIHFMKTSALVSQIWRDDFIKYPSEVFIFLALYIYAAIFIFFTKIARILATPTPVSLASCVGLSRFTLPIANPVAKRPTSDSQLAAYWQKLCRFYKLPDTIDRIYGI